VDQRVAAILDAKRAAATSHLIELRAFLVTAGTADSKAAWHCSDACLLRFLESCTVMHKGMHVKQVNVADAAKALVSSLKWRHENGLDVSPPIRDTHCCKGCEQSAFAHCFFSVGRDKRGWECLYLCPGRSEIKDPASIVRHISLQLESVFQGPFEHTGASVPPLSNCPCQSGFAQPSSTGTCQPAFAEQAVLLIDLHGFGLGDADPRLALRLVPLFVNHYPDRIAQAVILDAPWVFKGIWAMVAPLLDELGQMKCQMLRGSAMQQYLCAHLHDDQRTFMEGVLRLRAKPNAAAFPPSTAAVRRSLGPADKFTREHQQKTSGG